MSRSIAVVASLFLALGTTGTGLPSAPVEPLVTAAAAGEPAGAVGNALPAPGDPPVATTRTAPSTLGGVSRVVAAGAEVARSEPLAFFALFVAGIVLFAPGSVFTLAAGAAYGVWLGLALSVTATMVAAVIHFAIARHLLRGPVRRRLADRRSFRALDRAVSRDGWKIVGLTRLSALIPGAVQNCLYAVTCVRFRAFVLASIVGLIPPTLLVAAAGSTGGEILGARGGGAGGVSQLGVRGLSLLVLVVVVGYLVRRARRELRAPEVVERVAAPATTPTGPLLEERLERLSRGGLELRVPVEDADAGVPAQDRLVVPFGAELDRARVQVERPPEPVVGLVAGPRSAALVARLGVALPHDPLVVAARVLALELRDDLHGLPEGRREPVGELVGECEEHRGERALMAGIDGQDVQTDALGLRGLVQEPVVPGLLVRVVDRLGRETPELELVPVAHRRLVTVPPVLRWLTSRTRGRAAGADRRTGPRRVP